MKKGLIFTILFLIVLLLVLTQLFSQKNFRRNFFEKENFGISKELITNRDYIIFICWNIKVYGYSYPERIINLIPTGGNELNKLQAESYESLLKNSAPVVTDYILNPKYLDYPLTGLNKYQVMELLKWLNDRYNENILLREGYLNFTPDQKDNDCFILESYLAGQYTGSVRNDKVVYWKDNKFLPTFRLPAKDELELLELNNSSESKFREYRFTGRDFLSAWNAYYIREDKNGMSLRLRSLLDIQLPTKSTTRPKDYINASNLESIIEDSKNIFIHKRYFDDGDHGIKDKYGRMPFVVIGENDSDRAIIGDLNERAIEEGTENKIYRIAYSRILEHKYWP